jgi:hypothetical protein
MDVRRLAQPLAVSAARNVDIKARVADPAALRARVATLAGRVEGNPARVPRGRLKLRRFDDGSGALIFYERDDTPGDVAGLGHFMELEVVLGDGEPAADGEREAHDLLEALGLPASALLAPPTSTCWRRRADYNRWKGKIVVCTASTWRST